MVEHIGGFTSSVAQNVSSTIRPPSGEKWVIVALIIDTNTKVTITDGTNVKKIEESVSSPLMNLNLPITYTNYIEIENLDSSSQYVSYLGYKNV